MAILGALIMWLALSACEGGGLERPESRALEVPADLLRSAAATERGRKLFEQRCALCHGKRGDGQGARRTGLSSPPPSFLSERFRQAHGPRDIYRVIRHGKRGTSMPAWPTLSERQTWDLVAFVLHAGEHAP